MIEVPGYTVIEQLSATPHSVVYRARKEGLAETVILKTLKTAEPSPAEIARFKHEYELIRRVTVDGIIRVHDIIDHKGLLALVLEDFGGVSLKALVGEGFAVDCFLDLATRLAGILGNLHREGITHRDIKPGNILYNRTEDILKVSDFGIAAELTGRINEIYNPAVIEGTLAYMSPEQTGRINCPVDYRCDLYSLGITFYEMLTGGVPFMAKDPLEIIHGHIAKTPVAPRQLNPDVPEAVSAIVMKLLAKVPEDRYQNSYGLGYDLEECRRRLDTNGRIESFELARHDISLRFNMPQLIVGRDAERAILNEAFERADLSGVAVMLVTGEPGIGKSALVNEIRKPVLTKRGFFLAGKYDQLRRHVPYSAIIQAFQGLIHNVLAEDEARLRQWRKKIGEALSPNGKIITDVIPQLELILGPQPEIPDLGSDESRNRFNLVFKNFVKVFADPEHPLVLFLDDLQWADAASLSLIQSITTDKGLLRFLLIGAYRDDEVAAHHPLLLTIEEIAKIGLDIKTLKLQTLSLKAVNDIVANLLKCALELSGPLAKVVCEKTLGNPFFVNQFLKTLYEENYLAIDPISGWTWDIDAIRKMQVTDNVLDLMAEKIARLPDTCVALIKVCACVGNRFEIETLASVMGRSIDEILYTLDTLIQQGFINYTEELYRFHHDRIQEAAYSLIPEEEKAQFHLKIGRRLLAVTPEEELVEKIFFIADHFNHAGRLITTQQDKDLVVGLNLKAGLKAKSATAYAAAANYLATGVVFLPEQPWRTRYELTYALHTELMACEYLIRNFEASEALFSEIVHNAKDKSGRAKACRTMIELYTSIGKLSDAIALGIKNLKQFGVYLSPNAGKLAVVKELIRFKRYLHKYTLDQIVEHPMMTSEESLWITELCGAIGTPAYFTNPNLFAVTVLKAINTYSGTLINASAFGFMAAAVIIGSALGDHRTAMRIGGMAMRLNDKLKAKPYGAKVHLLYAFMVLHWTKPMRDCMPVYRKGYQLGLDSGDFTYACHCINAMNISRIIMGENLDEVLADHTRYKDFIEGLKDPFAFNNYLEIAHICLNLKGLTNDRFSLTTEDYDQEAHMAEVREDGQLLNYFYHLLIKERCYYLFGAYEEAYRIGFEIDDMLEVPRGTPHVGDHYFYRCLSLIAVYAGKSGKEKVKIRLILNMRKRKMKQWAEVCPANYAHRYLLIEAEWLKVKGRFKEALQLYRRAVASAREHGYTHIEALANERAGLFCLGHGIEEFASTYMIAACRAYKRWGATAKVNEIEKAYPELVAEEAKSYASMDIQSTVTGSTTNMTSTLLDISTILKVSQSVSSEIMLDRLLRNIMRMGLVNAGAQRGFLILDTDGVLTIEASEEEGKDDTQVMQSIPLTHGVGLSTAIVHYVHRSGLDVILGNAAYEGAFTNDAYIARQRCKSVLCFPIKNKGKISGILYMENNLTTNAFTPERLELLRLFSGQAAISLENARLFELATTDGLTKLFVHRYFQLLLDQEITRARRYEQSFSLIMIDIDNFKHFNDTYGHQLGDEVLRIVSRTIKKQSRALDITARYGGEEFVLILPETDTAGALIAAEKIRKAVEQAEIINGTQPLHVTISMGLATFPLHANEKESLIRSADNALFASKRSGKNRVSVGAKVG